MVLSSSTLGPSLNSKIKCCHIYLFIYFGIGVRSLTSGFRQVKVDLVSNFYLLYDNLDLNPHL